MSNYSFFRKQIIPLALWWICWAVAHAVVLHRLHFSWQVSFTDALISNALLAFASYAIIISFRFYHSGTSGYLYRFAYLMVLTVICVAANAYVLPFVLSSQTNYSDFLTASMPVRYLFSFLMLALIAAHCRLNFYQAEQSENKKRKAEAEILLRDAELAKLRQQLQPHFLFNSLNSISALAGSKPEQARKMIQQLSDFLRGTLKKDEQQLVELAEELNHLQLYLDIEKVRFGHRLKTEVTFTDESLGMKLPSLLLQPVVENAIKFGLYDTTETITISIRATHEKNNLHLCIQNPFDANTAKPKAGTGFGLNAVQKRLHLLYARNDLLEIQQKENIFYTLITIPQFT